MVRGKIKIKNDDLVPSMRIKSEEYYSITFPGLHM